MRVARRGAAGVVHAVFLIPLLIGLAAPCAFAQNAGNAAAAEALFDEGKAAMALHKYTEACPKFEESNRLDEGIGTSLWLADCYEKNGQSASAWAQFREAAALAVKFSDPREKVARERAQALEKRLSRLVLLVPMSARVLGLRITRDGSDVGLPLWGSSVPADPGQHTLVVSAPDYRPATLTIDVAPGPHEQTVTIPRLADAPAPVAFEVRVPPRLTLAPQVGASIQRIGAIALGAAGVISLGAGSYFGLHAKAELDDSNAAGHCQKNLCDATGVLDRSAARSAASVSTVLFVTGGAALLGGGALFWMSTRRQAGAAEPAHRAILPVKLTPWLGVQGAGVVLDTEF